VATYTITPDGGAEGNGCAVASRVRTFTYEFTENDFAFVQKKALKGLLEEVAIKEVQIGNDAYGQDYITYQDTWNSLWNEDELVAETDAIDLAVAYWNSYIAQLENLDLCAQRLPDANTIEIILEKIESLEARIPYMPIGGSYQRVLELGRLW